MIRLLLVAAAALRARADDNVCTRPWPDVCPPAGGPAPCTPFAPPPAAPTDWLRVRAALINDLFGVADGALPAALPDAVSAVPGNTSRGCLCSAQSNCPAAACAWASNMTSIVSTISVRVNASFTLTLNSTAFFTLNTSGVAPLPYSPVEPLFPAFPMPAQARGGTLVIVHQGHDLPCVQPPSYDYDGTVNFLNELGYDVMNLHMPTYQVNAGQAPYNISCDHAWFEQFAAQGAPVIGRFFLEPVVRAINYAVGPLGYQRVVMTGLSGGGWSTTMLAAIDPRIALSLPVAGSLPCDFRHTSWDFEQFCNNSWAMIANYTSLYVLGALEPGRASVQLVHEQDPCCFHGCGRHDRIREYRGWAAAQAGGVFHAAVTAGNKHETNGRDKTIIAALIEKLRLAGALSAEDVAQLPFDTLREW